MAAKINERPTGDDRALIISTGVGAPVSTPNVYITRGNGLHRLVAS
jgi:hypothetical protein